MMKKIKYITIVLLVFLSSCVKENDIMKKNIIPTFGTFGTFYEEEVFYTCSNSDNETLLCYYSKETDKPVPVCSKPDCTHRSKYSPGCNAIFNDIYGINRIGNKLYYFENDMENDTIVLWQCDLNGGNRRTIAAVGDVGIGMVWGVRYQDNFVLLTYYQMYKMEEEYRTGNSSSVELDKYRTFVAKFDLSSGAVEKIVEKEDYNATIWNAYIEGNELYYSYSWFSEPIVEGVNTRADVYRYGWYSFDLETNTETKITEGYDCMCPLKESFYHYSKDNIICYSTDDNGLYTYNFDTKQFKLIGHCEFTAALFTANDEYAIFLENYESTEYIRYCFKTGEIARIKKEPYPLGEMYLSGVNIVGNTAWIHYTDNENECMSYLDTEDFFNGNFESAHFAYNVNIYSNVDTNKISDNRIVDQSKVIRWGMPSGNINDDDVMSLNNLLNENGFDYSVEIIQFNMIDNQKNYFDLISEYEKINGSLDIVTIGGDWVDKIGDSYNNVKLGYFKELPDDNELYILIPKVLWDSVTISGKRYTIPGECFNNTGVTFCFNKKYINEEAIKAFDGSLSSMIKMLETIPQKDNLIPLYTDIDYLGQSVSYPFSIMGNILLSEKNNEFQNPYKNDRIIDYAKYMNWIYNNNYFKYNVDFSKLNTETEVIDPQKQDFAIMITQGRPPEEYIAYFADPCDIEYYSLPFYLENRLAYSTGVSAKSNKSEAAYSFIKMLYIDERYIRSLKFLTINKWSTGLDIIDRNEYVENVIISPNADFVLTYDSINEYASISKMCVDLFDRLCKAEDFDSELAKINDELEAAGIDEYVEYANKLLSEARNGSDN